MIFLVFFGLFGVVVVQGQPAAVDFVDGSTQYHYSWLHDDNKEYTQADAVAYCKDLEGGWSPISVETPQEDALITGVISFYNLKYIWTGGVKTAAGWTWPSGAAFQGLNWSHTGGLQQPQPDNREGNEDCLAILNNIYQDGIKWHDVACFYPKATICERSA